MAVKKWIVFLMVAGIFSGLIVFRGLQQRRIDENIPEAGAVNVAVVAMTRIAMSDVVRFSASIEPQEQAAVVSRVPGRTVVRVLVDEGDRVKKGQPLALLDKSVVEQQLAEAGAVYETAAADNERYQSLLAEEVVSRQAAEHAKSRFMQARAALEQVRLAAGYHTVTAPVEGVIAKRFIDPGDTSSPQGPAFIIFRQENVKAVGAVPERVYPGIKVGDPVSMKIDALPGDVFEAKVSRISPMIDPATRTASVEVFLPSGGIIRPGMFARVEIGTGKRELPALPLEAVGNLPGTGERICFIAEGDRAMLRVVQTGIEQNGMIEITGGLSPGEEVIVTRSSSIQDGTRIEVQRQ